MILDSNINPVLLSSFVGALSLFGKDSLGKIKEITIKGLDLDLIIVNKYNLVLVVIVDKAFMRDYLRDELGEKTLDMFYILYKKDIENFILSGVFDSFKKILYVQIDEYLEKIAAESPDFGFLNGVLKESKTESD